MPLVDIKFRKRKRVLTCEILKETADAYDLKYIDRDSKFRFIRVPKRDIEEIRPRLALLSS